MRSSRSWRALRGAAPLALGAMLLLAGGPVSAANFLPRVAGPIGTVGSTVPANGDVNPYGVAVVPRSVGRLVKGDVLVSNFNAKSNLQGTGTTIVQLAPTGARHLFATVMPASVAGRCPGGVGLTTALVALASGWVIVGSLPTTDGTAATAGAGCLIVLDSSGRVAETFAGGAINGPWDMTALDGGGFADLFFTNVLNGTVAAKGKTVRRGTVVRIVLQIQGVTKPVALSETIIGSGFGERTDPAALVVGPTGVGLAPDGMLYVADTLASRITAIPDATTRLTSAGVGHVVSTGGKLNAPLGLAVAPNRDILTVNGGDGNIVETTPAGTFVSTRTFDSTMGGGGLLFGLALTPDGGDVYAVNDGANTLELTHACPNWPNCPALAAGTYRSTGFLPQVTYTLPAGWSTDVDHPAEFRILPPGATGPGGDAGTNDVIAIHALIAATAADCNGGPQPGVGQTPTAIATYWASLPGLVTTAPQPVTVGGLSGVVMDIKISPTWTKDCPYAPGVPTVPLISGLNNTNLDSPIQAGWSTRNYLLALSGGTLVIQIQDVTGGSRFAQYEPIVQTFHFAQ